MAAGRSFRDRLGLEKRRHAAALQGALRALIPPAPSKNYAALGFSPRIGIPQSLI
jgi:hypothetical protein